MNFPAKMGTGAVAGGEPLLIAVMKWNIRGSLTSSLSDVNEALQFAARGAVKPHITVYPFEKWPEMNKKLAASQSRSRVALHGTKVGADPNLVFLS